MKLEILFIMADDTHLNKIIIDQMEKNWDIDDRDWWEATINLVNSSPQFENWLIKNKGKPTNRISRSHDVPPPEKLEEEKLWLSNDRVSHFENSFMPLIKTRSHAQPSKWYSKWKLIVCSTNNNSSTRVNLLLFCLNISNYNYSRNFIYCKLL